MIVQLTWLELQIAWIVAGQRRIISAKGNFTTTRHALDADQQRRHSSEFSDTIDVIGARGEMGAAKGLGLYWSGLDRTKTDIFGAEVRAKDKRNNRMILHDSDPDELPFISAFCDPNDPRRVELLGWMYAEDGKDKTYWSDPSGRNRPAYFVPNEDLAPMTDFPIVPRNQSRFYQLP